LDGTGLRSLEAPAGEPAALPVYSVLYFRYNRKSLRKDEADIPRYADMLAAMGTEPRLRIMRLLLSAHPGGLVAGEIHEALGITASTLSHHLMKLKSENLVTMHREGTFLRYAANTEALEELLTFLCAECCTRNPVVALKSVLAHARRGGRSHGRETAK
jgi:DNA-binding transcriptional ArsR family regulator